MPLFSEIWQYVFNYIQFKSKIEFKVLCLYVKECIVNVNPACYIIIKAKPS